MCTPSFHLPATPFSPTMFRTLASSVKATRTFSVSRAALAALVFKMPAMSPTMTEGGIVAWKFKPGDAFSAGDVLLEVETDKATIDVEAQDDGVMWDILVQDGATGIPVGKPIAFLAEPGDDLATLEKPLLEEATAEKKDEKKEDEKAPEPAPKPQEKKQEPAPTQQKTDQLRDTTVFNAANPQKALFPSVERLLHKHNISAEDAYAKIPASGPNGRILLGDVLAYLGDIDKSAVAKVANYIKDREHLDLSNIKIAPPKEKADKAPEKEAAEPVKPSNILHIEFTSELGEGISKEKFRFAFERALESAKRQTYATRFPEYSRSPVASSLYENDDIFDDLLVAPVSKDRFEVFDVSYQFIGETSATGVTNAYDDFDELLGLSQPSQTVTESAPESVVVGFSLKYDDKLSDSKDFVDFFQDALLSQIPSKQLIIHN